MSPTVKRLLEWDFLIGHCNLHATQIIICSPPFGTDKFLSSSRITLEKRPKCEVFQYSKANYKAIHGKKTRIDAAYEGYLYYNHIRPVYGVYVGHSESRLKYRNYNSFNSSTSE